MTGRRGFALAAVLGALVLMAMVVAVSAQRALLMARQGAFDAARADLSAALASAEAAALEMPVDTAALVRQPPGATLAAGSVTVGAATARWTIVATGTPFATLDLAAFAALRQGRARESRRGLVTPAPDAAGALRWVAMEGAGRVRLPSL